MRLKAGGQPRARGEDTIKFLKSTLEHGLAKGPNVWNIHCVIVIQKRYQY